MAHPLPKLTKQMHSITKKWDSGCDLTQAKSIAFMHVKLGFPNGTPAKCVASPLKPARVSCCVLVAKKASLPLPMMFGALPNGTPHGNMSYHTFMLKYL